MSPLKSHVAQISIISLVSFFSNWLVFLLQDEVRISKKDYESDRARMYGPIDMWHHVDCFVKKRVELEFFESGDVLPGYNTLSVDDKKMLKGKLKKFEV